MDTSEAMLQVNRLARRNRHLRNFSKTGVLSWSGQVLASAITSPIELIKSSNTYKKLGAATTEAKNFALDLLPVSPKRRLMFNAGVIAAAGIISSSLSSGATFVPASMDYSADYISAYSVPGDILVSDESGYMVKINPQTEDSNRIGLTDYAVHTVASGESLSAVSVQYDVSVETIMWENGIGNANSIRSGQKLLIPPVDGVSYDVKSGDSLDKIAAKYEIPAEAIIAQNGLDSETLKKGQSIFLPGAEPIQPIIVSAPSSTYRNVSVNLDERSYASAEPNTSAPAAGKWMLFPTKGLITQGYHGGHYALDIADRSKPAVWSAASGTVIKASTGTWGGGYGNHVIIDHGNGYQTLYAHLDSVNVYAGQAVGQGDVLGIMGNTGRVYGATGIHLHWEVRYNGVKQNPYNFY